MQCPFSNFQESVCKSFSKTLPLLWWCTPVTHGALYALRTDGNTAEQAHCGGYNFNFTALLSERVAFSPRTHCVCGVFVTKRIVPVLGYDCSQRHTCEGTTLNLNINLPTENFHSYWYSPLCLVLRENFVLWRNNDIQDFLNMCILFGSFAFIRANIHWSNSQGTAPLSYSSPSLCVTQDPVWLLINWAPPPNKKKRNNEKTGKASGKTKTAKKTKNVPVLAFYPTNYFFLSNKATLVTHVKCIRWNPFLKTTLLQ